MSSKTTAGAAATTTDQAAVRSGAIGASGIEGGFSTPDYGFLSPQQSAGVAKAVPTTLEEFIKTLGGTSTGHSAKARQSQGASAFREAPQAQGSHNIDIGTILKTYFGMQ